jgi:pimeloyl-ACP methyl ester carboxylesterase
METIFSTDQTVIAYNKTGTGTPLVMVHGTNGSYTHWNLALPQLSQHFTVYAMERRGRGASGDAPTYTIEREFEDVAPRSPIQSAARWMSSATPLAQPVSWEPHRKSPTCAG